MKNFLFQSFNLSAGAGKTSERRMTASSDSTMSKNFDFIRNAVKMLFPQSKVFLYGSHNYGLADDRSDLNAYIDLGEKNRFAFDSRQFLFNISFR